MPGSVQEGACTAKKEDCKTEKSEKEVVFEEEE